MTAAKRLLIAVTAVAMVIASGAFAWKATRSPAPQANAQSAVATRPLELIPQEVHTIEPRGLVDTVRFTGTTQPVDQTVVKARVAGRLAEVLVREGDKVAKGQLLARFETTELQAKVNVVCMSDHTVSSEGHSHPVIISDSLSTTQAYAVGEHGIDLACGPGTIAITPGRPKFAKGI